MLFVMAVVVGPPLGGWGPVAAQRGPGVLKDCHMEYYNAARTHLSLARTHQSDAPFSQQGPSKRDLFSAACTTNMSEFDLRQAQLARC